MIILGIKELDIFNQVKKYCNSIYGCISTYLPAQYPSHKKRRIIWYKTLNKSEIIKAINIDQLFKCIVLKKGKDFYEYNYAIKQYETEEGKNLFITEKEVGNFEKYVYPIICKKNIL